MGQAKVPRHHPKGEDWKWAQEAFRERPIQFISTTPLVNPIVKRINRQLRRLDKKFESTNPKAKLILAELSYRYEKLSARKDATIKSMEV